MNTLIELSPASLRKAADLQEEILALQGELYQLLGQPAPATAAEVPASAAKPKKRQLSAAGLAGIRAGVRRRTARQHGHVVNERPALKPKRTVSAAVSAARSAAAKARWKAAKAAGRNRL